MKRILMICCLFAASATYSNAQSAAPALDVAAPVSKTDFTQKVKDLNTLIQQEKTAEANTKFDEISQMINAELKVVRYKMRDAKTDAERQAAMKQTQTQRASYGQIMSLRNEMVKNRVELIDKLNEFAGTI